MTNLYQQSAECLQEDIKNLEKELEQNPSDKDLEERIEFLKTKLETLKSRY